MSPGPLDGDAVGDGQRRGRRHGLAAPQRLGVGRAGGDLHADDLHLRPRGLDGDRDAGGQPAAAHRDDDAREVGHVLDQLEPERALAGDDVAGRRRGARRPSPPSRACACAMAMHSSSDSPPTWTCAPCPRLASALAIGALAGTKTSQRTPRAAATAASAWAWLPAEAATTPCAQPSSPSASSLADAPRTLNEPVRWRFSALRATMPPARSEIVRLESTGVRRATRSTAARAASMSSRRDAHQSGRARIASISTSRAERQRGDADRRARRRLALEVGRRRPR